MRLNNSPGSSGRYDAAIFRENEYHVYLAESVTAWPRELPRGFIGNPHEWEDTLIDLMDLRRLRR